MNIDPSATVLLAPPSWIVLTAYSTAPTAVSHTAPMTASTTNVVLNAVI